VDFVKIDTISVYTRFLQPAGSSSSNQNMSTAPAVETEAAIAMRRLMQAEARVMQAEASITQAEARVLQQWNELRAILAKPPQERQVGELESAQAALKFAETAHARAVTACGAAELAQTNTSASIAKADPSATASTSSSARQRSPPSRENAPDDVCITRHPLAAMAKQRGAEEEHDNCKPGNFDGEGKGAEPSSKRSKSTSSSSAPSSSPSSLSSSSAFLSSASSSSSISQADIERKKVPFFDQNLDRCALLIA
jgi:hypothetical protein